MRPFEEHVQSSVPACFAEVLRRDIPAGREALRSVLAGPAEAVPILVNGAPRFLSARSSPRSAVLESNGALKTNVADRLVESLRDPTR